MVKLERECVMLDRDNVDVCVDGCGCVRWNVYVPIDVVNFPSDHVPAPPSP